MATVTIPQKMSGTGTIHDLRSDHFERDIVFRGSAKYAVVLAAYYGGKGYTTHKDEYATIRQWRKLGNYSRGIIGRDGTVYDVDNARLRAIGTEIQ